MEVSIYAPEDVYCVEVPSMERVSYFRSSLFDVGCFILFRNYRYQGFAVALFGIIHASLGLVADSLTAICL